MSEESDTPMVVDLGYVNAHYWNSTVDREVMKSESSELTDTTHRSEDGPNSEPISESIETGAGGDDDLSQPIDVEDCQQRLQIIQDRVSRIVGRMSSLTESLRHMHVGLKRNKLLQLPSVPESEEKNAMGDVGSTQTDPPVQPILNMLAERIGDSVACQTKEDTY